MTLSLRGRLFVTDVLVVGIAIGLATGLASLQQRRWLLDQHGDALERSARQVAEQFDATAARDPHGYAASVGALTGYRVTLIDPAGRVIGDSGVERTRLAALEPHGGRPEVRAALAGRAGRAVRTSASVDVELLYVAVPASVPAVVRLAEPLTALTALDRSWWRLSLAAAGLALLLSVPLALWVAGWQAARIRELERVTHRLGAGERSARALEQPPDELGRLGAAINAMAAELRERLAALEREGEERDRILLHMRDGVALIDDSGHVVRMNRSLATILKAGTPAPPGTPFFEFVRSPEIDELLRAARSGGRPVETDLRLWSPGPRLVHATATPLGGAGRGAVLLVLHDLTDLERLDRVRQDFVANVSHELRTPLTSLRGYAETLLEGGLDDREHREGFVRVIRDQAARLETLVDDLLALAELERPGLGLRAQAFAWGAAIRAQAELARPAAAARGLTLLIEGEEGPEVSAERARVEAVVANLVDNAIKYTEQGRVRVRWGGDESRAWLEVEDTGPGIPAEDQPRIFERFYRVDKARSRARGGTGLGLSIVKHIAAVHGGEVSVHSAPGSGSTFRFVIPRHPST